MTMGTAKWFILVAGFCKGKARAFIFMNKNMRNAVVIPRTEYFAAAQAMYDGSSMSLLSCAVAAK